MKVLHIEDRFHASMGYQINFFAKYHSPTYQFFILTSDSSRIWTASDQQEAPGKIDKEFEAEHQVSILRLPTALDRRVKQNIWIKGLIRNIRKIKPDILYVHTLESYSATRVLLNKKILSECTIYFDTHTLLNQFQKGLKFKLHCWFLRNIASKRISRYGGRVFATVQENKMILEKVYGISKEHILYSPIGTDLSVFSFDQESRDELRQQRQIMDKETVLIYTGKLNFRKNPHLILEAIALVESRIREPLYLCFVGAADPVYREEYLNRKFSNKNIRIEFVPAVHVSELSAWYSMADFAVFPDENTLSALDAQACRLPVIMQSDMTNEERLSQGGLTYTKGDLDDLSEKILNLLQNPDLRKKLGRDGETLIRSKYDYRKIVMEMESDLGIFA